MEESNEGLFFTFWKMEPILGGGNVFLEDCAREDDLDYQTVQVLVDVVDEVFRRKFEQGHSPLAVALIEKNKSIISFEHSACFL